MSVSRGCFIIETKPEQWWCAVACSEHDYEIRRGEKFGPAKTAEEAFQMMRTRNSNPGGSITIPFAKVSDHHRNLLSRMDYF